MGRSSKTTEFLKECMADALIKLMESKAFSKITSDEIAAVAGVGRATWFRNFTSKEDAIRYKLHIAWEKYAEEHDLT
ncbi:MAG: TetR/AcrR family transcriptional regulator, partial [Eubacteriales bacterium]